MTPASRPFSAASQRNRDPILEALKPHFEDRRRVLEIGSGTGQHAVHFAAAMPWLTWQSSDRIENLEGVRAWLAHAGLDNTPPPLKLDVTQHEWPAGPFDAIYSANTLHIMAWPEVEAMFARLPSICSDDAVLAIYGPFNIDGRYTSESNAAFDASLKARGPHMGLRDRAEVDRLAAQAGFRPLDDVELPANNRLRLWRHD